jgi:hypothetical protein
LFDPWSHLPTRKHVSELGARSCQPRHDCARRAIEQCRNLLIGELFVFAEEDDFAGIERKLLDRSSHLLLLDPVYVPTMRILRCIGGLVSDIFVCVELD